MSEILLNLKERASGGPRILLTDTNRWPVVTRLAIAFWKRGCDVAVLCPMPGHPVQKASGVAHIFHYNGFRPLVSLKTAIDEFDPDIIVPACDRGVQHLHELYVLSQRQGSADRKISTLIERSLGSPDSFPIVSSRWGLLDVARAEGIPVPRMSAIGSLADLKRWHVESELPWVIKADGTWGGRGVRIAHNVKEAERCFLELTKPAGVAQLIKRIVLNRDRGWEVRDWKRSRPAVIAQSLINGRPANCAVVCSQGKILAGIAVEVVRAQGSTAPATLVEVVEGQEMMFAAERIAQRLGLSGFFGLDFVIENGSGATYLIEMNPRCTPPCPLPLGKGHDLVAAMWAHLVGQPLPETQSMTTKSRIAYFPQAWMSAEECHDDLLDTSYHDVPDGDPALIHELLHPWPARSVAGQLVDFIRRKRGYRKAPAVFVMDGANPALNPIAKRDDFV
jgi:carbamoylphosphate synthase large subunit